MDKETFYQEAFERNNGILTKEQQDAIQSATVAIAGLGGGGGIYAYALARTGFTKFHLADFDTFSLVNFNRQIGATEASLGKKKTETIRDLILSINPYAEITLFEQGIHQDNIHDFLRGVSVVVDGIDFFEIETRRMLFREARNSGIHVVTCGPVGFGASILVFDPRGLSFDRYMDIQDSLTEKQKLMRFGIGVTPTLLQRRYFAPSAISWKKGEHRAPSLGVGTLLAANFVGTEVVKVVTGQFSKIRYAPRSIHCDPYLQVYKKVWLPGGNRNPLQKLKLFIMERILSSR